MVVRGIPNPLAEVRFLHGSPSIMSLKYSDSQKRTITKVITYRIVITCSHIINGFMISGSLAAGLQIAGLAAIINSVLFWVHERLWNWLQWNRRNSTSKLFVEGATRSLSKIITWRVFSAASNFLIPYLITGSWGSAAAFLGIAVVVNMALYYLHERTWDNIAWGKLVNNT